jgi:hypothetical protein
MERSHYILTFQNFFYLACAEFCLPLKKKYEEKSLILAFQNFFLLSVRPSVRTARTRMREFLMLGIIFFSILVLNIVVNTDNYI